MTTQDLINRLRDTASKGVSVWGDLQMEAAKEIETLLAERECYASAMDRMQAALAEPSEPVATIEISERGSSRTIDTHFAWCVRDWPCGEYELFTHPASKPEPSEPVAEVAGDYNTKHIIFLPAGIALEVGDKLFTHPAKPEPLTDEAISKMYIEHSAYQEEGPETSGWYDFARAVEAAILEKLK